MNNQENHYIGVGTGGCKITTNLTEQQSSKPLLIDEKFDLSQLKMSYEFYYVIATLGGETGSNEVIKVISSLKKENKQMSVILIEPLSFEGKKRIQLATNTIEQIESIFNGSYSLLSSCDISDEYNGIKVNYLDIIELERVFDNISHKTSMKQAFLEVENIIKRYISDYMINKHLFVIKD